MIIFPLSFFSFFMSTKDWFFFSSFMEVESSFLILIFLFVSSFILVLMSKFNQVLNKDFYTYVSMMAICFLFLLVCFFTSSSFFFLFSLEISSCVMIFMVMNFSKDFDKLSSSIFMFLFNICGSIPFMYFCFFSMDISPVFLFSSLLFESNFLFFCCFLMLLSKLPCFFLHFWLTKAHVASFGPGSMILASIMLKIGFMGHFKFSPLFFNSYLKLDLVYSVCPIMMVLLTISMFRYFDLKYLIACSSILHMSPMFPVLLEENNFGWSGSYMMTIGHGLISYFLFFLITLLYEATFNRTFDFNKSFESQKKHLSLMIFLFFLLNLGFPPFISFMSEMMFLYSFLSISFFVFSFFLLALLISGLVFLVLVLKILYMKKSMYNPSNISLMNFMFFILFFFFVVISSLLFF